VHEAEHELGAEFDEGEEEAGKSAVDDEEQAANDDEAPAA
jgi:hypothetical protein